MNTNAVARNYDRLSPEERFRLILAASGRGDVAERERLGSAGQRITLSLQDHSPYSHAFKELAQLTFIELAEDAAVYSDGFVHAADARDVCDDEEEVNDDEADEAEEGPAGRGRRKKPASQRFVDLALAAGYVLRVKAEGWKLFCERLSVPPFLLWEGLPGFDRLQRELALAEKAAFTPEGFLRWMNAVRPPGEPRLTTVPLTAEGVATATEGLFRERVKWWGG